MKPLIAVIVGFVLALLWYAQRAQDPSGYGMVTLGLILLGVPALALLGVLAFLFRSTFVGDYLGSACVGLFMFLVLLVMLG